MAYKSEPPDMRSIHLVARCFIRLSATTILSAPPSNIMATKHQSTKRTATSNSSLTAPIFTLPVELLFIIFLGVVDDDLADKERPREWRDLVSVSRVCQLWRSITLQGASDLWGMVLSLYLSSGEPSTRRNNLVVDELLHRTENVPLSIKACIPSENRDPLLLSRPAWGHTLQNASRFRIFRFSFNSPIKIEPLITEFFTKPAPLLEEISWKVGPSYTHLVRHLPQEPLFAGEAPNLRRVTMDGARSSLEMFSGLNLTHLHVTRNISYRPPCVSKWVELLGEQPGLEELTLERCMVDDDDSEVTSTKAQLPRLRSFVLAQSTACCVQLLDRLELPSLDHLEVVGSSIYPSAEMDALTDVLSRHLASERWTLKPFSCLTMAIDSSWPSIQIHAHDAHKTKSLSISYCCTFLSSSGLVPAVEGVAYDPDSDGISEGGPSADSTDDENDRTAFWVDDLNSVTDREEKLDAGYGTPEETPGEEIFRETIAKLFNKINSFGLLSKCADLALDIRRSPPQLIYLIHDCIQSLDGVRDVEISLRSPVNDLMLLFNGHRGSARQMQLNVVDGHLRPSALDDAPTAYLKVV
ncbi:hypothetical protein NLJ89_g9758 [Agrocybe chaxingu]|uniref:F-box domain-containing protein n=1 Tax=Agrocybe chaxingu TaxID=84603 RepID=A0A9W8JZY9_9AGAR|nr:hypothetical protein NLJ89_g9758 [Agrocybe chaxingu]